MANSCPTAHSSKLCILHLQRYQKQLPFSNLIVWAMIRDSVGRKRLYSLLVLLATEFGMPLQNVSILKMLGFLVQTFCYLPAPLSLISRWPSFSHNSSKSLINLAFIHPSLFYHWNIILGLILKKSKNNHNTCYYLRDQDCFLKILHLHLAETNA